MASTNRNIDSVEAGKEVQPRKQRDEPMMTGGHAPGVLVGNDAVPEFSAETLPAGTAPADRTFQPNPINETPGQANNPDVLRAHGKETTKTDPLSTLGGATSKDVHTGLGQPISGQTANEPGNKGGQRIPLEAGLPGQEVDERLHPKQRGLEKEGGHLAGTKGAPHDFPSAEERIPESAETVASGR